MSDHQLVLLLVLLWLLYFTLHSLLAANGIKTKLTRRFPRLLPYYRLLYNLLAIITLLPPLHLVYFETGYTLWQWQGGWRWVANGLAGIATLLFLWSLRYYNGADFLGLLGIRSGGQAARKPTLVISPLHRWVRHPWYTIGLVIVWTRDLDLLWLVSALLITAYFFIGALWEEKKLVLEFGPAYRRYQQRVPGIIPLPWKHLSERESAEILKLGKSPST